MIKYICNDINHVYQLRASLFWCLPIMSQQQRIKWLWCLSGDEEIYVIHSEVVSTILRDTFGEHVYFDMTEILTSTSDESTLPNLSTTQSVPGPVSHIAAGRSKSIVPSSSLEWNTIVSASNMSTFRKYAHTPSNVGVL